MMRCRYDVLGALLAFLDGAAADPLPRCDEQAKWRARVQRSVGDESVVTQIRAELCPDHDADARSDDGYGGSWVMRDTSRT